MLQALKVSVGGESVEEYVVEHSVEHFSALPDPLKAVYNARRGRLSRRG